MSISNLGNGIGILYVTDTSSNVLLNIPNDSNAPSYALEQGNTSAPLSGEVLGSVTIDYSGITTSAGAYDITTSAHGLIGTALAGPPLTSLPVLANDITLNVNGYTAIANGTTLIISAPVGTGSSFNSVTVTPTVAFPSPPVPVPPLVPTNFSGGADASGVASAGANGRRFYLNASVSATQGDISGATEITQSIVGRSLTSAIYSQDQSILAGVVVPERVSNISTMIVDTQGMIALDDLDSVSTAGFSDGDIIQLKPKSTVRVIRITYPGSGNLKVANATFLSDTPTSNIWFQYDASLNQWNEVFRSPGLNLSTSSQRGQGIPAAVPGTTTVTMPTSGTLNLTAGVDTGVQVIIGSPVMVANYAITPIGSPINGDRFEIIWQATPTTGINTVTVFGKLLTAEQVQAKATIAAVYNSTQLAWDVTLITDGFSSTYATTSALTSGLATKQDNLGFPAANNYILSRNIVGSPFWIPSPASTVYIVSINISSAQMLLLNTSPQILIPAPGAGFAIQPIGHLFGQRLYGTIAYAAASNFGARYTGAGLNIYTSTAGLMTGTGNQLECTNFTSATSFTPVENTDFEIYAVAANPTLGDSQFQFTVLYTIVPLI